MTSTVVKQANNERYLFIEQCRSFAHILFKIYQINSHQLLVIDNSIADVEKRSIHPGYGLDDGKEISNEAHDSSADRAMATFKVKKIKLTQDKPNKSANVNASQISSVSASSSTRNISDANYTSTAASSSTRNISGANSTSTMSTSTRYVVISHSRNLLIEFVRVHFVVVCLGLSPLVN